MPLNKEEKELLAVVRYYNTQVNSKKVQKLIGKLFSTAGGGFDIPDIAALTGIDEESVRKMVNENLMPKVRKALKATPVKPNPEPIDATEPTATPFDTSTVYGRAANEAVAEIIAVYTPGEEFLSQREFIDKFSVSKKTALEVMGLLLEKGILKKNETPRRPHVVA